MNEPTSLTTYRSYVSDALRTDVDYTAVVGRLVTDVKKFQLLHALIGLSTETGELMDTFKKHVFYGQKLDIDNLLEEQGDLFWYLALLSNYLGDANFNRALQSNIAKLRVRYPGRFTEADAQARKDKQNE